MSEITEGHCPFCGAEAYEIRHTDYLYSHDGDYLLVPNTPVQVCTQCGMIFYEAAVLEEIERRFFAIKQNRENQTITSRCLRPILPKPPLFFLRETLEGITTRA